MAEETKINDSVQDFEKVSFDEFAIPEYDAWVAEVEKALKGAPFEKKMFTKTYEGITLEPIYTPKRNQDAIATSVFPGKGDYTRGAKASGYIAAPWGIAQHVEDSLPVDCNESALMEIEKGSTVYNIRLDEATKHNLDVTVGEDVGVNGVSLSNKKDMVELIKGFQFDKYPVYIEAGASAAIFLSVLAAAMEAEGKSLKDLKGLVGADPIGVLAQEGKLVLSLESAFDEMAHTAAWAKENAPGLRTILVCGDAYHNGGSNDVQEVAYTMNTAIAYVREMQQRGMSIHDIADQMMFTFSLGANFFMEIAKMRAIRLIWAQIMEAFGADEEHRRIYIHGRTSAFTKTVYDPYVNMLRDTTQAFSGVVGGLDSMEVSPFDMPIRKSDIFSRRISRNIQVMMTTEFELTQPVDPAGGSWYIETLTMQLTDKIWAELQVVEGKGGILDALKEGYPQAQVKAILTQRFTALEKRSDVAVGNNMYANMTETLLDARPEEQGKLMSARQDAILAAEKTRNGDLACNLVGELMKGDTTPGGLMKLLIDCAQQQVTMKEMRQALRDSDIESIEVEAIAPHRWTEKFEEMRMRTEKYKAEHNDNVKIFLANMGPIPQHKPRADFSTGFMEVAAFEVLKNDGFPTPDEAAAAAAESGADVVIICSTDATYPEIVPVLAKQLKEKMPDKKVFLAGAPAKEFEQTYIDAGVDDFIHVRANCYKVLTSLQKAKGMMD